MKHQNTGSGTRKYCGLQNAKIGAVIYMVFKPDSLPVGKERQFIRTRAAAESTAEKYASAAS